MASQQVPVPVLGHPLRTGEVGIVSAFGAGVLVTRVNSEHDSGNLLPRCAFLGCVEQSQIKNRMGAIIVGDLRFGWSGVCDWR